MPLKAPRFSVGDCPIYFPSPAWGQGIPVLARLGTQVEVVERFDHGSFFGYDVRCPDGRLTRVLETDLKAPGEAPLVVPCTGWVKPIPRAAVGQVVVYRPREWFMPYVGDTSHRYVGQAGEIIEVRDQGDFYSYLLLFGDDATRRVVDHELAEWA